jgi:hypothetical protein
MVDKLKRAVAFKIMLQQFKKLMPSKFLIGGIKIGSFGIVFGPSKSGKTIYCEILAMCIASGKKDFLGDEIDIDAQKVLFLGLEEFWSNRVGRNFKQFETLTSEEKELYNKYFLYQPVGFLRFIQKKGDWVELKKLIKESSAKFVFIDSITRMNHGNLEDSKVAQEIMQNLRDICYDLKVTLICIHHTPKMYGKQITMDSIKGSSVFSQEADFAIGINKVNKRRYQKDVFFRYKADDTEFVKEFKIDDNVCLEYFGEKLEYDILNGEDGRKDSSNKDTILNFFKDSSCKIHKTSELIKYFTGKLSIKERQIKNHLKVLVVEGKIINEKNGYYKFFDCTNVVKEGTDE